MAVAFAGAKPSSNQLATPDFSLQQTFSLPAVPKGVIPESSKLAMDSAFTPYQEYGYDSMFSEGLGFLGYSYLAQLSQRAEYRKPAEIVAEYMTKNWLEFKGVGGDDKTEKIKQLEDEFKRLHVKDAFAKAAELDCYYGRSQIFIDTGNQEPAELIMKLPAVPAKIKKNGIKKIKVIEPYWTYPNDYNSTNPLADDFFRPNSWFVMGQQIHTTRFLNFVARPVSDILKPVYNFGGLSLTQILKPYVDNWLRTRQSVSDLLYSFSINVLKTNMGSILSGGGGEDVGLRVDIFNRYRDNRGCFVLDKDSEDFINVSAPLGTIDKLQAQSQEQMASIAGIPLIILLKITPSGLNASSEGEIRTFNDWIESQQVSLFGPQMDRLLPMIQLSLWGEIDPDITYKWVTLNPKDEIADANRRKVEADTDAVYIQEGVIDTTEARTRLAKQEDSPYAGLDLSVVPEPPQESEEEVGGGEDLLGEELRTPGMDGGPGSGVKGHTTPRDGVGFKNNQKESVDTSGFPLSMSGNYVNLSDPEYREHIKKKVEKGRDVDYDPMPSFDKIVEVANDPQYTLKEDEQVFFALSGDKFKNMQVGDTFTARGSRSTTKELDRAKRYGKDGAIFKLDIPAGSQAVYSNVFDIDEIVLLPGAKFKVTGKDGDTLKVELTDDGKGYINEVNEWKMELDKITGKTK